MVIGGGLAGIEAAKTLALRGHRVTLYEKSDKLGGQWHIASLQAQKREDYRPLLNYLFRSLEKTDAAVKLNTEVTEELIKDVRPDAVVAATGAVPQTLNIEGAGGRNVVQAVDVIQGKAEVGNKAVVIGGRYLGMEMADELADQGKDIYLATRSQLGRDMERNIYLELRNRLIDKGVYIYQNSPAVEIMENGIYISFIGDLVFLKADTIVMAVGMKAENRLSESIKGLISEIFTIGDCVSPRDAMTAIREGAEIGRKI